MAHSDHIRWLKEGVDAWNERRRSTRFRPDLRGANLAKAELVGIDLRDALLSRAYMLRADLRNADLSGADLSKCDGPGTIFAGAALEEATIVDSDFSGGNFADVSAQRISLDDTLLANAKMTGADLKKASFKNTDLTGAQLHGADLMDVRGLSQGQLESAQGDARTRLPQERVRPSDWRVADGADAENDALFERIYSVVESRFDAVLTLSGAVLIGTQQEIQRLRTTEHRPQDAAILGEVGRLFAGFVATLSRAQPSDRHDAIEAVTNLAAEFEPKLEAWITEHGFSLKTCSLSASYLATTFGALGVVGVGGERVRLFFDGLEIGQSRRAA